MSSKSKSRQPLPRVNQRRLREADLVAHATRDFGLDPSPMFNIDPVFDRVRVVAEAAGLTAHAVFVAMMARVSVPALDVYIVGDTRADVARVHQLADELLKQLELT